MKWIARLILLPFSLGAAGILGLCDYIAPLFWEASEYWRKKLYK